MWMGVYSDWVTEGNAYLVKIRNGQGAVIQLWWIPDHLIEPRWEPNSNQFIGWYEYTVDGRVLKIEPKDIIHFRYGLDPYNPRKSTRTKRRRRLVPPYSRTWVCRGLSFPPKATSYMK